MADESARGAPTQDPPDGETHRVPSRLWYAPGSNAGQYVTEDTVLDALLCPLRRCRACHPAGSDQRGMGQTPAAFRTASTMSSFSQATSRSVRPK
jgi:hypothetical protein